MSDHDVTYYAVSWLNAHRGNDLWRVIQDQKRADRGFANKPKDVFHHIQPEIAYLYVIRRPFGTDFPTRIEGHLLVPDCDDSILIGPLCWTKKAMKRVQRDRAKIADISREL